MTAITLVGGTQVITLAPRRLVVGIRLHGTIGHIDPHNPYHVRARPYLSYLAETLRRLKCDVTLVLPPIASDAQTMMKAFSMHDFQVPFRYVLDAAPRMSSGGGHGNKKGSVAPVNYGNFFQIVSEEAGSDLTRVLFLDAEVNYRFNPTQTLILEEYEPLTRRQVRQLARGELDMTPEQAARYGLQSHRDARRQRHLISVAEQIEKVSRSTAFLTREMQEAKARDTAAALNDGGSGRWLGRHGGPRAGDDASEQASSRRQHEAERDHRVRVRAVAEQSGAPLSIDGVDLEWAAANANEKDGKSEGERSDKDAHASSSSAAAKSLAINLEDYTLVAVAEMVAEMAASDTRVGEYLKMEPLIEKLNVPNHGTAHYLPIENCDYMDLMNWEEIKVQERQVEEEKRVPDVEETDEHKDFFQ